MERCYAVAGRQGRVNSELRNVAPGDHDEYIMQVSVRLNFLRFLSDIVLIENIVQLNDDYSKKSAFFIFQIDTLPNCR